MLRVLIGLAVIAGVIAFAVSKMSDEGMNNGPTQIVVETPNPLGGDGGDDGGIYVP